MATSDQRADRIPNPSAYPPPVIGGAHVKARDLAAPVPQYGNPPGTLAAVVRPPAVEPTTDGATPLLVLELPETVLTAVARAVHLGAGADGARAFARIATGDAASMRSLLAVPVVREALSLTLTTDDAWTLSDRLAETIGSADALAADVQQARSEPDPDAAHDARVDDELATATATAAVEAVTR